MAMIKRSIRLFLRPSLFRLVHISVPDRLRRSPSSISISNRPIPIHLSSNSPILGQNLLKSPLRIPQLNFLKSPLQILQLRNFNKNSNTRPKGPSKPKSLEYKARTNKFICWHCKVKFNGAKPLRAHNEIHHPEIMAAKVRVDCTCGNGFPRGEGFLEHLDTCPRPPGKSRTEAYKKLIQDLRESRKEAQEMLKLKGRNRGDAPPEDADVNWMNYALADDGKDAPPEDDDTEEMNHALVDPDDGGGGPWEDDFDAGDAPGGPSPNNEAEDGN